MSLKMLNILLLSKSVRRTFWRLLLASVNFIEGANINLSMLKIDFTRSPFTGKCMNFRHGKSKIMFK